MDVGLRELRQNASDLVRRVEAGEVVTVTVSGRPAARLVPVARRQWREADEVAGLLRSEPDESWRADRERLDDGVRDPWTAE